LAGRAMTLAFIHRVGGSSLGDPPEAWLMPLLGDAVIGVSAIVIAFLILNRKGLAVWTLVIVWNSVAIWDALSAFVINTTNPWPEFFMLKMVGPAMFFIASLMHLTAIILVSRSTSRAYFLE